MTTSFSRARAAAIGACFILAASFGLFGSGAQAQAAAEQPNLYDLRGGGITVNFAASSFDGRPQLYYTSMGQRQSFFGDQLTFTESPIGVLVSVQIGANPDLNTTTFTLVVPRINAEMGQTVTVRTQGFITVERTSIAGPSILRGQIQTSRVIALTGTAQVVQF